MSYEPPSPPPLVEAPPPGRALCFAPHPDDEVIGPGGALALHRDRGEPVRVCVASDGSAGDPDDRHGDGFVALRESESRAALAMLGVDEVEFWSFPDACVLTESDLRLGVAKARAALRAFAPQVVYAPWSGERNPDHHALHVVVARALEAEAFGGVALGYEIWDAMRPDYVVEITRVFDRKCEAVRCHASQVAYVDYERAVRGLNSYRSVQHLKGRGWCEGYCDLVEGRYVWQRGEAT